MPHNNILSYYMHISCKNIYSTRHATCHTTNTHSHACARRKPALTCGQHGWWLVAGVAVQLVGQWLDVVCGQLGRTAQLAAGLAVNARCCICKDSLLLCDFCFVLILRFSFQRRNSLNLCMESNADTGLKAT